jgi:hypothetical protein
MLLDKEEIRLLMQALFYVGGDWEERDNLKVVSPAYPDVVAPDALRQIKGILGDIGINTGDHLVYLANSHKRWHQRVVIDCPKLSNALHDNNINIINFITEKKAQYQEAIQNVEVGLNPAPPFRSLIDNYNDALEMLNQKLIENTFHP